MKTILKTLIISLITLSTFAQKITLSGYVREQGSKESLSNVSVMIPTLKVGTQTNNYGFFSLTIPASEEVEITFSSLGYQVQKRIVKATENQQFEV